MRYSLNEAAGADKIERAVAKALTQARTADIYTPDSNTRLVTCSEMGELVASLVK